MCVSTELAIDVLILIHPGGQIALKIVPLSAALFQRAYWEQWVPKHPPLDQSALMLLGRPIDLHQLHTEVTKSGSYQVVGSISSNRTSGMHGELSRVRSGQPEGLMAFHRGTVGIHPIAW